MSLVISSFRWAMPSFLLTGTFCFTHMPLSMPLFSYAILSLRRRYNIIITPYYTPLRHYKHFVALSANAFIVTFFISFSIIFASLFATQYYFCAIIIAITYTTLTMACITAYHIVIITFHLRHYLHFMTCCFLMSCHSPLFFNITLPLPCLTSVIDFISLIGLSFTFTYTPQHYMLLARHAMNIEATLIARLCHWCHYAMPIMLMRTPDTALMRHYAIGFYAAITASAQRQELPPRHAPRHYHCHYYYFALFFCFSYIWLPRLLAYMFSAFLLPLFQCHFHWRVIDHAVADTLIFAD